MLNPHDYLIDPGEKKSQSAQGGNAAAEFLRTLASIGLDKLASGKASGNSKDLSPDMASFGLLGTLMGPIDAALLRGAEGKIASPSEIDRVYEARSRGQLRRGHAAVRNDMANHRAFDAEALQLSTTMSVWDKLSAVQFNDSQRDRIMNSFAYVREGFAQRRGADGQIDPDQKGNWLHTMDELDAVLDRTHGQHPAAIEKSVMAMFGDAWKTKRNFTTHNVDGRQVALKVLGRQTDSEFTAEDVHGIGEANAEHQISPPGLMGMIYAGMIKGGLNAERSSLFNDLSAKAKTETLVGMDAETYKQLSELSGQDEARLSELATLQEMPDPDAATLAIMNALLERTKAGRFLSDDEYEAINSLQEKIGNPYAFPVEPTATGGYGVSLTKIERQLLERTGLDYWYRPYEGTAWFKESRDGVVADILANLGLGGRRKLTGLNGPDTDPLYEFGTIRECVNSGLKTYADIDKILSEEELSFVRTRLGSVDQGVSRAIARTAEWLKQQEPQLTESDPELERVPFLSDSAPLVYPQRGANEFRWRQINKTAEADRTPEEAAFWRDHRMDGLDATQQEDYLRAVRIRDHVVEELGKELRIDDRFVPDFRPVMHRRTGKSGSTAGAEGTGSAARIPLRNRPA